MEGPEGRGWPSATTRPGGRLTGEPPLYYLRSPTTPCYYVDVRTARIVAAYSARSRWNRWLYHGLHSFDLPWLYRYRPAWDIFVLVLLLGGATLSVTAVTIGWQLLGNKLRRAGRFH
jgi:hypothetical protein